MDSTAVVLLDDILINIDMVISYSGEIESSDLSPLMTMNCQRCFSRYCCSSIKDIYI